MKKVRIEMVNKTNGEVENLILVPVDKENEEYLIGDVIADEICMHVRVDEGYCWTDYYYPVDKFYIRSASLMEN